MMDFLGHVTYYTHFFTSILLFILIQIYTTFKTFKNVNSFAIYDFKYEVYGTNRGFLKINCFL